MSDPKPTVIKVFGLGGGGSNAVNRMIELGLDGVEFLAANTDAQALGLSLAPVKIQLGPHSTRGLGAGGKPEIGESAADESREELRAALAGADLVFLTAGMGGGTGTGAIAIAAEVAQSLGALTVAIVTTPFSFEATRRRQNAEQGLAKLRPHVDTLVTVPNDKLLTLLGRSTRLDVALRVADEVLRQGVQGVTELISRAGLINVDFANVRAIMQGAGSAMMAIGQGRGNAKAEEAIQQALKMPLLDVPSLRGARGVLVHFTGGDDLSLYEVSVAAEKARQFAPEAEIVFGATHDPMMTGRAQAILIVTGFEIAREMSRPALLEARRPAPEPTPVPAPPTGQLADALFSRALSAGAPAPEAETWAVGQPPAADPNSLDVPAFLRRRRSLRDFGS
jgi:cell division protein FtsZ